MIPDTEIEIPCCKFCHDWMRPTLLVAHPYDAVLWVCENGCASLLHGRGHHEPDWYEAMILSLIGRERLGL